MVVAKAEAPKPQVQSSLELSSPEITPDGISYSICRQPDFLKECNRVIAQVKNSGVDYGWIVFIKRGGEYPAKEIARALGLEKVTFSVAATHYDEFGKRLPEVKIYEDLTEEQVALILATGKPGLLVDEINDSTQTSDRISEWLIEKHGLPKPDLAVLEQKPLNMAHSARFFALDLPVDPQTRNYPWRIYPWEWGVETNFEFFRAKIKEWQEKFGKTLAECFTIFKNIGFNEEELPPFLRSFGRYPQELQKQGVG